MVQATFNLPQAAAKVGMSEALLVEWISTGKFKPTIEMTLEPGEKTIVDVTRNGYVWGEDPFIWHRHTLTDRDLARLYAIVQQIDVRKTKTELAHVEGVNYSDQELGSLWCLDVEKIRELFENEPDVMKLKDRPREAGRGDVTLGIPGSVAGRVLSRYS
jgi:hypothetical protein